MKLTRRDNGLSGYHAQSGRIKTDVIVGGKDIPADKFVPAINMSFHGDEFYLDLNHIDSPITDRVDVHADGKVTHAGGGFKHEFYTADDNTLKWDMLFDSPDAVPDTIRFRIKASKGLLFLKQELTAKDIADGCEYTVPEVKGSYAVYIDDKRNGKYCNGKVCHIYSPFYVDENGNKSPLLDMTITPDGDNAKMLILTKTQAVIEWLTDPIRAGHKIRLDPTVGYSVAGASFYNGVGGYDFAMKFASEASAGTIQTVHAFVTNVNASLLPVKVSIFTDPVIAKDSPLLDWAELTPLATGSSEVSASATLGGAILASTDYWVSWGLTSAGSTGMTFDGGFSTEIIYFNTVLAYVNMPQDPYVWNTSTNTAVRYSAWVVYAPAVSNAIPPHVFARVK